jgi:SAM-dependent methyltransferase
MNVLEQIASGFMEAKVLLAAAELRLFDALRGKGATAEEAARAVRGTVRGTTMLLDALAAMEVISKTGHVYRNHPDLEPFLLDDAPSHYTAMLRHRNLLFRRWAALEDIITGKAGVEGHAHRPLLTERDANENFIRAMCAVTREIASQVVDHNDLGGVRTIADFGGGPGVYLEEICRRRPDIQAYLVDLPLTLEVARKILAGSEAGGRLRLVPWDLFKDPPPSDLPPLDLALISQVIHGEGREENRALFAKLASLLNPGGRLLVHERIVSADRTQPRDAAIFAVNMLAMTPAGNVYTEEEIHAWGRAAGLVPEPGESVSDRTFLVRLRRPLEPATRR